MDNTINSKIIENLESRNKTLKYTLNIEKSEISENNFWLKFIWNIAKNALRSEFKEKILEEIENEKKYFDENVSLKINEFIWVKRWKEFNVLCDLIFQKNSSDWNFFLDKKNICEFKNDYFVTFPNRLISISPVFWIEKEFVEKFFLELKNNFLENLNESWKIFYGKILEILEKKSGIILENNSSINWEISEFFWKIMATQESVDKKLLNIYRNEILNFAKSFSKNNWENIFNQKIEIWFNSDKKSFHILDWTHRFKAVFDLFIEWKIELKFLNNFDINFSNSLISCDKNLTEILENWNFWEEILKDEKISDFVKIVYWK